MSIDENGKVSNPVSDTGGQPTPDFSNKDVSPTSNLTPEQIGEFSKALRPIIEETVSRTLQSTKDKRFSTLERSTNAIMETLAELKAAGATIPPEVEREYQNRQYIEERIAAATRPSAQQSNDSGLSKDSALAQANSILDKFGIEKNDPQLAALWLSKKYADSPEGYIQMLSDVTDLAAKRVRQPKPLPGQEPALPGKVPATTLGQDALRGEYDAAAKTLVGNPEAIARLRSEYRAKGLNI